MSGFFAGKPVLVTGGTGFVGLNLVSALLKAGARVRVPVHRRAMPLSHRRLETVRADLGTLKGAVAACRGARFVFHAAGPVGSAYVTVKEPMRVLEGITANLLLTGNVLQAAWTCGAERFLTIGSSTGYPAVGHPVREEEFWTGELHPSYFGYGWMRRYLERLAEFAAAKSGMHLSLVRPTAIYGPYDNFDPRAGHVIPALIRRALAKEDPFVVWGDGGETRDFLHIADLARGCLLMMEKAPSGEPVNIAYGKPVRIKDVVRLVLKAAGHSRAKVVFDASKPSTIPYRAADTSRARRLLGFKPAYTLEEGLRSTVAWYRRNGRS